MECIPQRSKKTAVTPSEILLDSMNHSPVRYNLIRAEHCDISSREMIEKALSHPIACIPKKFKQAYHDFQYIQQKQYLLQVNCLAQLAFLIYFWADSFIIPDVSILSGSIRVISIIFAFSLNILLFKYIKNIQMLDLILPLSTCLSAILWFEILLQSASSAVLLYQYAAVIFIVLGNLCIQVHFRPSLITSCLITAAIFFGAWRLNELHNFVIFLMVYVPILAFSIYICWNNTLNSRKNFLRALLDDWNYHTLKKLAHTDELTQLSNRRQFLYAADRTIQAAAKTDSISLLIFDVDLFKNINDQYGHDIGDQVLCAIAAIARTEMRFYDMLARFGGEEFIALLPHTSANDAIKIAERLRQKMQNYHMSRLHPQLKFTISVGVALSKNGKLNINQLIKQADIALYEAKRLGRNQVIHFDEMQHCSQPLRETL